MAGGVKSDSDTISEINIVPLVDIILVVLIIFMVASPSSEKSKINVDLPEASSGEALTTGNEPFNVVINEDGYVFVNGDMVSESELRTRAELEIKKNSQVEALVTADKNLDYGKIVKTIDLVKSSGVNKISISTTSSLED